MSNARLQPGDVVLDLVVQPRASRTGFGGWRAERAKIRIAAPPLDGRANLALIAFLAGEFAVPRSRVEIVKGETSREKSVVIRAPATVPAWVTAPRDRG